MLPSLLISLALGAEPARFAYLSAGARVCVDPALKGPCFSLRPEDQRSVEDPPSILRHLGEERGAVALEVMPAGVALRCLSAPPLPAPGGLRVYAARSDVLSTTTREVRVEGGDGTAVTLAAGVPLLPSGKKAWIVHPSLEGLAIAAPLALRLPGDAIGSFYPANAGFRSEDMPLLASPGATATLLGEPVKVGGDRGLPARDLDGAPGGLVELRAACLLYQVEPDPSAFELVDREVTASAGLLGSMSDDDLARLQGGIGGLIGASDGVLRTRSDALVHRFPAKTPLAWEGGAAAGALEEVLLASADELRREGDLLCLSRAAGYPLSPGAAVPSVRACQPAPPPTPAGGPTIGDPIILGALDKPLIDAVIRENLGSIRRCYQDALAAKPALAGKVTIKFVIAKDGSVAKADVKSSTMGDAEVEGCIASQFLRFRFPEPRGGGIVIVSYPFLFSPG